MQKLLSTFILILIFCISLSAEDNTVNKTKIPLNTEKNETIKRHPQAPARIPVVCSHDEYSVFVESRYSLFADITVEDESGTIIASTATMLTPELPLSLSINEAGTFEITIQIEDTIYTGTFTL